MLYRSTRYRGGKNLRQVIDWGKLRELLGDNVADDEPEVYDFTWVGKRAAQREAMAPIRKTLRPCPEESVNWDTTQNLYIEGDNLEVLKLLQNSYMGKVKMIYIDPPYNTGNDFVYHDDFTQSSEEYDEHNKNEEGERYFSKGEIDENGAYRRNTDSNGRFHSDWCSMIYSRLLVARSLLTEDGVIFISIDDNEVDNLQKVCNEVYGEANYMARIIHKNNSMKNQSKFIGITTEYVLLYCKNIDYLKLVESEWRIRKKGTSDVKKMFFSLKEKGLTIDEIREEILNMYSRPKYSHLGRWNKVDEYGVFTDKDLSRSNGYKDFTIVNPETGKPCLIPSRGWGKTKDDIEQLQKNNMIWYGDDNTPPREKSYLSDAADSVFDNYLYIDTSIDKKMLDDLFASQVFEYPKPVEMIYTFLQLCTKKDSVIVDFFSGSATTAHAVMQLNAEDGGNRKFIMVQWPEETEEKSEAYKAGYKNICEIGKERIRRAGKKIKEENPDAKDLDIGFRVFKCDESNYKNVAFAPKDYSQESLDLFVDNIKEDRTDLDLLFDCMLRWGITLDLPMTKTRVDGCTIHNVNEGGLVACFDGIITEKVIDAIAEMYPAKIVFRDSSFEEAAQKMNLFELFKQKCNWTEQEVRNNVRVI